MINLRINKFIMVYIFAIYFILTGGGMGVSEANYEKLSDVPDNIFEKINSKRIYFGHQSVGNNIISGLNTIQKENPRIKINIVEIDKIEALEKPVFAHSKIGKNRDPISKIRHFAENIDNGIGKNADYVALKLCYVDIKAHTNVEEIFNFYSDTIKKLKEKHPSITVIHFTVPLKTVQTGYKAWIKKIIKKTPGGYDDNIKRNKYNEYLRNKYQGSDPIFDIAKIESMSPDGSHEFITNKGKIYDTLFPQYTDDGGHLNALGQRTVAEKLILMFASLI